MTWHSQRLQYNSHLLKLLWAVCEEHGEHLHGVEAHIVVVLVQEREQARDVVWPLDKDLREANAEIALIGRRAWRARVRLTRLVFAWGFRSEQKAIVGEVGVKKCRGRSTPSHKASS